MSEQARPRLAELVAWLRSGLDRVGRGRREGLARRARVSVSTVGAAVAGGRVPTWEVTAAIAAACGLDAAVTTRLWRAACAEREGYPEVADPDGVVTAVEFARELRALLLDSAGLVGVRAIAAAAGLSRSAAGRALLGVAVPGEPALEALLAPCRLTLAEHQRWMAARARLAGAPVPGLVLGEPVLDGLAAGTAASPSAGGPAVEVLAPARGRPSLVAVPELAETAMPAVHDVDVVHAGGGAERNAPPTSGTDAASDAAPDTVSFSDGRRGVEGHPAPLLHPAAMTRGWAGRGSRYLDAAVLAAWVARELRGLHAGLGVHRAELEIGRTLGEVCGVDFRAPANAQRRQLEAALAAAAGELPGELAWPALVAFNLAAAGSGSDRPGSDGLGEGRNSGDVQVWSTFSGRVKFLARALDRDSRTVRRYVTQAERRLAEVLADRYFQARDQLDDQPHDLGRDNGRRGTGASPAHTAMS